MSTTSPEAAATPASASAVARADRAAAAKAARAARADRSRVVVFGAIAIFAVGVPTFFNRTDNPVLENWATILLAITLQALPFLVLGVVLSALLSTFVEPGALARLVPKQTAIAVPVAALAGAALPGCECSSVPVAGRLLSRGVPPAAALTFLLAAPAINPVVLVATAVAFPGRPQMVLARFVASVLAATAVGLIWSRRGDASKLQFRGHEHTGTPWERLSATMTQDLAQAAGFLVLGATIVATLQTAVPPTTMESFGGTGLLSVLALAMLAVVMSVCSEADAFVVAGLTQYSLTARLVFLVVGPMVDLKLIAMQAGAFGSKFARVFAPLTFVCAIASGLIVGRILL